MGSVDSVYLFVFNQVHIFLNTKVSDCMELHKITDSFTLTYLSLLFLVVVHIPHTDTLSFFNLSFKFLSEDIYWHFHNMVDLLLTVEIWLSAEFFFISTLRCTEEPFYLSIPSLGHGLESKVTLMNGCNAVRAHPVKHTITSTLASYSVNQLQYISGCASTPFPLLLHLTRGVYN